MIIFVGLDSFDADFSCCAMDANTIGEERAEIKAKMSTRKIIPELIG